MELVDILNIISRVPDHARNPRNHGPLREFNGHARITGPCGDTMEFWLHANGGVVEQIGFTTTGCSSSLACGSMTTCMAKGKDIREILDLQQKDILEALGGVPKESEHCALLSTNTLKAACENYLNHSTDTEKEG
ncbi:MAG: iron-sulfur cluster assembly scaffold protein [Deltaproteobacteria bacterium]|nr:iron-sulfur cluster assembly scaffold protein [Deltaproteobacteria bacterium]